MQKTVKWGQILEIPWDGPDPHSGENDVQMKWEEEELKSGVRRGAD